jgi:hypothetical protein
LLGGTLIKQGIRQLTKHRIELAGADDNYQTSPLAFLQPSTRRISLCWLVPYDQKREKMKKNEQRNQHGETDQKYHGRSIPCDLSLDLS